MAHFSYYSPFGVWPVNSVIPHGFLQQLDQNLFKAINGDDGGTWAPSSQIVIGGAGLWLTAPAFFNGSVRIGDNSSDTLVVEATSVFDGEAGFSGGLTTTSLDVIIGPSNLTNVFCTSVHSTGAVSCVGITNTGSTTVGTTLGVTGSSTLAAVACTTLVASGAVTCNSEITTNGNLVVANGSTFTAGAQVFSGTARPARPAAIGAASGGGTLSVQVANEYYFPAVTVDETYQISDTGAVDGDYLDVFNKSNVHTVSINDQFGSLMVTIKNVSGQIAGVHIKRITGTWTITNYCFVP